MMAQLIICTCIYVLFFLVKNNENNFSKQTLENVSNILSYDINLKKIYISCEEYLKKQNFLKLNIDKSDEKQDENMQEIEQEIKNENTVIENNNEQVSESSENLENQKTQSEEIPANENQENVDNNGIGGGEIPQEQIPETNKSQMEIDSEYIKQSYNLIIPVNGNITSGFGNREPTEIISAFHQGVDIGAAIRNSNLCINGGYCNCSLICRRLWESY